MNRFDGVRVRFTQIVEEVMMVRRVFLAFLVFGVTACGDDGTDVIPCTDDTGSVEVTVTTGTSVQFDWEPACAMTFLLVEQGAGDVWFIGTDPPGTDPDAVNLITPPVTYGVTPSAVDELFGPETLLAGVTYDVILARVPPGSTAECINEVFSLCFMAIHEFVR
jgi:hypothetical protein